jgi:hypothetical protein
VILPLTLAAATAAAQQATVTGRITDQASGQPIQEARVIVLGTSQFTTSGVDGKYTVRNVPVGNADIRVIRVGYQEQRNRADDGGRIVRSTTMTAVVRLQEVGDHRHGGSGMASEIRCRARRSKIVASIHQMGIFCGGRACKCFPGNMTGAGSRVAYGAPPRFRFRTIDPYVIDDSIDGSNDE